MLSQLLARCPNRPFQSKPVITQGTESLLSKKCFSKDFICNIVHMVPRSPMLSIPTTRGVGAFGRGTSYIRRNAGNWDIGIRIQGIM